MMPSCFLHKLPPGVKFCNSLQHCQGENGEKPPKESQNAERVTLLGHQPDTSNKHKKYGKENVAPGQKDARARMSQEPQRCKDVRAGRAEQNKNTVKPFFSRDICYAYVFWAWTCLQASNHLLKGVFQTSDKVKLATSTCDCAHKTSSMEWSWDYFPKHF